MRKCSQVLYVPVVDVGWSQDLGRLLLEGALSVGWFGRMRLSVPVVNQSIHWVMVPELLLWNEQQNIKNEN
jgi:hypothetical protein